MTSPKQIAANQANAAHSTGPRTESGKATTRLNGLKHGLTGLMRLMPDEDQTDYARHCEGIVESLKPESELELRLAQSIADDYWRIDRIRRIEQTLFLLNAPDEVQVTIDHQKQLDLYTVYESRVSRNARNNLAELRKIQADRRANTEDLNQPDQEEDDENGSAFSDERFNFVQNMIAAELRAVNQKHPLPVPDENHPKNPAEGGWVQNRDKFLL